MPVKDWHQFTIVFLNGVTNGSIYALVAIGYTLVYGILELINFAHGDVFTWGAMVTYTVARQLARPRRLPERLPPLRLPHPRARLRARPSAPRSTLASSAWPTGHSGTRPDSRR